MLIAVIEYLRSGESKVGFLNKSIKKNMLHKAEEDEVGLESSIMEAGKDVSDTIGEGVQLVTEGRKQEKRGNGAGADNGAGGGRITQRRPSRKRRLTDVGQKGRDIKVRRK